MMLMLQATTNTIAITVAGAVTIAVGTAATALPANPGWQVGDMLEIGSDASGLKGYRGTVTVVTSQSALVVQPAPGTALAAESANFYRIPQNQAKQKNYI